ACSGGRSQTTPSASRRSALPARLLIARLWCLAMCTPAAAATMAAMVEMLMVPFPSPPVPAVSSTGPSVTTGRAASRMTRPRPVISSIVSPFMRRATAKAPIWAGVAEPPTMSAMASEASCSLRSTRSTTFASASRIPIPLASSTLSLASRRRRRHRFLDPVRAECPCNVQKIGQELLSLRRERRFRMELDALDRKLPVPDPHDDPVSGAGGDFQARGDRPGLDDQRMIAGCDERIWEPAIHRPSVVLDRRDFSMEERGGAHDPSSKDLADGLVSQTDPEDRRGRGETVDDAWG